LIKEAPQFLALELAKRPDFHGTIRLEILDQQEKKEQNDVVATQNSKNNQPKNGFKVPLELRLFHEQESGEAHAELKSAFSRRIGFGHVGHQACSNLPAFQGAGNDQLDSFLVLLAGEAQLHQLGIGENLSYFIV
jgi:hypothetical protein